MNIYHITRKDQVLGGQVIQAVIIAQSENDARLTAQNAFNEYNNEVNFPKDELVNCTPIGIATIDKEGVLMSEYNEGVF